MGLEPVFKKIILKCKNSKNWFLSNTQQMSEGSKEKKIIFSIWEITLQTKDTEIAPPLLIRSFNTVWYEMN